MDDLIDFPDDLTPEGTLALYLARDFARAGMPPERITDSACHVATHMFAELRHRRMLQDQPKEGDA